MKITNLKDVPVANDKLLRDTILETKENKKAVEEIIKHVGTFIANTIKRGEMEGVMIPEFGKFKPKQNKLLTKKRVIRERDNGMDTLYRALNGKPIFDKHKPKSKPDETI